jgi:hypothetical protein
MLGKNIGILFSQFFRPNEKIEAVAKQIATASIL